MSLSFHPLSAKVHWINDHELKQLLCRFRLSPLYLPEEGFPFAKIWQDKYGIHSSHGSQYLMYTSKTVFIIWNTYNRRPDVLAQHMDCDIVFISHIIDNRGPYWKYFFWLDYLYKSIYTMAYLFWHRPAVVFAQSPPSFCPMVCWIYCKTFGRKLVVDGHNNAFESPWIKVPLYVKTLEKSFRVLVHNEELQAELRESYPKMPLVTLPDKIPQFSENGQHDLSALPYLLVVLSYAGDEPLEVLFEAMAAYRQQSGQEMAFKITGNYKRQPQFYERYKMVDGIHFLGFVSNEQYEKELKGAMGVVALTSRQKTQQCASVEAMGAGIPQIVSDTDTNCRLLFKGALIVPIESAALQRAFSQFPKQHPVLREEILEVRSHWREQWQKSYDALCLALYGRHLTGAIESIAE